MVSISDEATAVPLGAAVTVMTLRVEIPDDVSKLVVEGCSEMVVSTVRTVVSKAVVVDKKVVRPPGTVVKNVLVPSLSTRDSAVEAWKVVSRNGGSLGAGTVMVIVVLALLDGAFVELAISAVMESHTAKVDP